MIILILIIINIKINFINKINKNNNYLFIKKLYKLYE